MANEIFANPHTPISDFLDLNQDKITLTADELADMLNNAEQFGKEYLFLHTLIRSQAAPVDIADSRRKLNELLDTIQTEVGGFNEL